MSIGGETSGVQVKAVTAALAIVLVALGPPLLTLPLVAADDGPQDIQSDPRLDEDRDRLLDDLDLVVDEAAEADRFKVIVRMVEPPSATTLDDLKAAVGDFTVTSSRGGPNNEGSFWTVIPAFAAELTKPQILALAERSDVKHIANADKGATLAVDTARESTGVNVALHPDILNLTGDLDDDPYNFTKDDVVVCVIDTGLDINHTAFAADDPSSSYAHKFAQNPPDDYSTWWKDVAAVPSSEPVDLRGHGTSMASIVAGHDRRNMTNTSNIASAPFLGVAPGAALAIVRGSPSGSAILDLETLIDGVEWCAGVFNGNEGPDFVDIISGSWGIKVTSECLESEPDLVDAVEAAVDADIIAVFSAGNDGPGECTLHQPSNSDKVISVGMASDPLNPSCSIPDAPDPLWTYGGGWYLNAHSSRGSTSLPAANPLVKPDILAPGVCIMSAAADTPTTNPPDPPYDAGSGTSPATAFVAGVIALMLEITGKKARANDPNGLTPAQVKQILEDTAVATSWGPSGKDAEFGAGVMFARAAITKACTTMFTDATSRTNICKTNAAGVAQPPNEDPDQPQHESRTQSLADSTLQTGPRTDKWTLNISDTDWPISITLIIPNWPSSEFELKFRNSSGDLLAEASEISRQETITPESVASNAEYTIEIINPLGTGGTYWLDVSAGGSLETSPTQDQ